MKYKVLVIRALWVIIMLLMEIWKLHRGDTSSASGFALANRFQVDLMSYLDTQDTGIIAEMQTLKDKLKEREE